MADLQTAPNIVIDTIGGNCPVQAEGTIDGWPFYFRARGSHWSLEVAEPGFEPCGEAVWRHAAKYSDDLYDAGWMTEDEARAFIAQAAPLFVAWRAESPDVDGSGRTTAFMLRAALARAYEDMGKRAQERFAAEREVVQLSHALGLDPSERYLIATLHVRNGVL